MAARSVTDNEETKIALIRTMTSNNEHAFPGRIKESQDFVSNQSYYDFTGFAGGTLNTIFPQCQLSQWLEGNRFYIKRYKRKMGGGSSIESTTNTILT